MNNKGFTLIELVIAIFILVFAIIGVYNAFSTVVVLTTGASSRFTAAYLAQEGIEIVRNMRDNNWLKMEEAPETIWTDGLLECEDGCEADYKTGTLPALILVPWTSGGNYLKINNNNGFYSYDSTGEYTETKFKRKIIITQNPATPNVFQVTVLVTWKEKEEEGCVYGYCIEAEEYLYNWY